jgi:DNA mismatch repair protein MutL
LCETEGKLILIDQHAAHERVGFEKLLLQYQKDGIPHNRLLITETFDLKPSDVDILKRYLDELHRFGFEIEFFGGNTFVLKAVPTLLEGRIDVQQLIVDLIEDVKATGELVSLKDSIHAVLAKMACHAQIRANHHLGISEIKSLLKELDEYQFTDFCPHGRPVSVEITTDEIEKWFRRVL